MLEPVDVPSLLVTLTLKVMFSVYVSDSQSWTGDVSTFQSILRLHVDRFIYIRTNVTFLPEQISYI